MDSEAMQYISKINEGREMTNIDALAGVAQVLAGTEYDDANEWSSKEEDPGPWPMPRTDRKNCHPFLDKRF